MLISIASRVNTASDIAGWSNRARREVNNQGAAARYQVAHIDELRARVHTLVQLLIPARDGGHPV